jgi:hypothetical protein
MGRNAAYSLVAELARSVRETMTSQHAESTLSCVWAECRQYLRFPRGHAAYLYYRCPSGHCWNVHKDNPQMVDVTPLPPKP